MNITFKSDIAAQAPKKLGRFTLFNTRTFDWWGTHFATTAEAKEILDGWHFEDQPEKRGLMIIVKI